MIKKEQKIGIKKRKKKLIESIGKKIEKKLENHNKNLEINIKL